MTGVASGLHDGAPSAEGDRALAVAAARGEPRARSALVERLLDRVRRTTSYLTLTADEADDLAQIALMEVLGSAGTFRGECKLETWADGITIRVAAQHLRKRTRREGLLARFGLAPEAPPAVEETVDLGQIRGRIAYHLSKLTPERRTAFVLRHALGHSVAEVAELTGVPVNTVRDRLRVARGQLRKRALADPVLRDWAAEGGES